MKLTHIDSKGKANMVDISSKDETERTASAYAEVSVSQKLFRLIKKNEIEKGDVLSIAKIAGIQAAKKTADLIPLCHPLMLTSVAVEFRIDRAGSCVHIDAICKVSGKTGVEMEALTAVSVAALTIYDMCKAVDREMEIRNVGLLSKSGGKSGDWQRTPGQSD